MARWHWRAWCACAALAAGACGGDSEQGGEDGDVNEPPARWDLVVQRALPHLPAAFGVRAEGDVLLVRTEEGLWRSRDGGRTFASWTLAGPIDALPLPDGGALQLIRRGGAADATPALERLDAGGGATAIDLSADWGEASLWIGGRLTAGAPASGRVWLEAYGRLGETSLAPTRLFRVDTAAPARATEVALPAGLPAGSVWSIADYGAGVAIATFDGETPVLALGDGDGAWQGPVVHPGLIDMIGTTGGALIVSRALDGAASLVRLEPGPVGAEGQPSFLTERSTPVSAAFTLARGADGVLFAVSRTFIAPTSEAGKVVMRSDDDGRTWQTLAEGLAPTSAFRSDVAVASTGLWSTDAHFVAWRPHGGGPWRLAGLSARVEVPFLQREGDELWAVTARAPGERGGGQHLLRSTDRGDTWQFAAQLGVSTSCFAVAREFLFFGGVADSRGAAWETRDRTGRTLIRNERVRIEGDPPDAGYTIHACVSAGGRGVLLSQGEDGKRPSVERDVNLQHQWTPGEPVAWSTHPQGPNRVRFTAYDPDETGSTPLWATAEDLIPMAFGFETAALTAFYDTGAFGWVFSTDLMFPQIGARAAVRLHDDVYVYPGGVFHRGWQRPDTTSGLPDGAVVLDALDDDTGEMWLGTTHGLFRSGAPPGFPAGPDEPGPGPGGCRVDGDCDGFSGGNLCAAQERCIDGTCQHQPLNNCAGVPTPPCHQSVCDGATGLCVTSALPDDYPCAGGDACHEPGRCRGGECQPGAPITCTVGTECAPPVCHPLQGCIVQYVPAGTPCAAGAEDAEDACDLPGRCTGATPECTAGGARDCDDGDPCTADACDPAAGCSHARLATPECASAAACAGAGDGAPCDDEDACTSGDHCQDGSCVASPRACADDHNPCTSDQCVPGEGCSYRPIDEGLACGHGDPCRADGVCLAGWCVGGEASPDGTPCASGAACVSGERCHDGTCGGGVASADGASCDDGLACSSGDRCERGFCVGALDDPECPGLAACQTCDAPAGPALVVAYAGPGAEFGIVVLALGGAVLSSFDTGEVGGFGVEHDKVRGDGLWVTSARSLWKLGWDGAILEELPIAFQAVGMTAVGGLDHVPGGWNGADVFVLKAGSFEKALYVVDAATGAPVLQSLTVGQLNAVAVDGFATRPGGSFPEPSYWTGGQDGLVHAMLGTQDGALEPLPPLDGTARGIAIDPDSGDLWVVAVQFDSQIYRIDKRGRVLATLLVTWPEGLDPDTDAFDLSLWPGRRPFRADP